MSERKGFQPLSGKDNPHFLQDGKLVYAVLKERYPKETIEHLDNVLNGLCAALTCLMTTSVEKDNRRNFVQLVYKILSDNIDSDA